MTESVIICQNEECGRPMTSASKEETPEKTGILQIYACAGCNRKAAIIFEGGAGLSTGDKSWVENEIATRGSFFPGDYGGDGSGPRRF